ncbi:ArsR/SmtB family transcription factor [Anaerovorax sp. IOR16]|uniref:ArsR/SmtB family transcription factor n=1 Tax=Anaerovorax sp. IOR16 TaxID=2773458 RepID=UPI0019CF7E4E
MKDYKNTNDINRDKNKNEDNEKKECFEKNQDELLKEDNLTHVTEILKVLANENRLMILCVLMEQPLSVSEIGNRVSHITQSALSQHLSVLKAHGILSSKKTGQNIVYSISDHRVEAIIQVLKERYCN